jgi:hypothetical protein
MSFVEVGADVTSTQRQVTVLTRFESRRCTTASETIAFGIDYSINLEPLSLA